MAYCIGKKENDIPDSEPIAAAQPTHNQQLAPSIISNATIEAIASPTPNHFPNPHCGYFTQRGINAWSQGEVPHYITSNPTTAAAYAEIVFTHWHDQTQYLSSDQPFYLCELGASSGRFAFQFLTQLTQLCQHHQLPLTHFRYISSSKTL